MNINFLLFKKSLANSWKRLLLITGSIATGIVILLLFTAYFNALQDKSHGKFAQGLYANAENTKTVPANVDPVYILTNWDMYKGDSYPVYRAQTVSDKSPHILKGLPNPKPGEYYASPALAKLIRDNTDNFRTDRYQNLRLIGEIPEKYLAGSSNLMAIVGVEYPIKDGKIITNPEAESSAMDVAYAAHYSFDDPTDTSESVVTKVANMVVYTGVVILILPIILLISIATKLGSVQRAQRYASLRLIGFTNRQIIHMITLETTLSTTLGIIIGIVLYFLCRPLLFDFSIGGITYWPSAINVTPWQFIVIIATTYALAIFANLWGMRHVTTSPLGVSKRQKVEKKPGWWRAIPLAIILGVVVWINSASPRATSTSSQSVVDLQMFYMQLFILCVLGLMVSLIIIAPWLTYIISKLIAKFSKNPTTVLATKYINVHSRAITRSVLGVILALFAGSFYIISTSGIPALESKLQKDNPYYQLHENSAIISDAMSPLADQLQAHQKSPNSYIEKSVRVDNFYSYIIGPCTTISDYISGLECDKGKYIAYNLDYNAEYNNGEKAIYSNQSDLIQKIIEAHKLKDLSDVRSFNKNVALLLDLKPGHDEKLSSLITKYLGNVTKLNTVSTELHTATDAKRSDIDPTIQSLANLAYGGMGITLAVAIISITVSTIGGLLERRRSLYTLRLSGMQISELRRIIIIESLIPLIFMSLLSVVVGAWMAGIFISITVSQKTLTTQVTPEYLIILLGSLAIAIVAIYAVLPMLNRLTNPSANQTE